MGSTGLMTGSETRICSIGFGWDSDQTLMSLALMVMTN